MDGERFDALSRALVGVSHRRRLFQAASGGTLGTVVAWLDRREAAACRRKGRRCERNRQCCDKGVCVRGRCRCRAACRDATTPCGDSFCRDCFIEDNPHTPRPRTEFCCTAAQICRSPMGSGFDICCYDDEVCDAASGTCCRTCGDGAGGQTCCRSDMFCSTTTNECEVFSSARLHRFRR